VTNDVADPPGTRIRRPRFLPQGGGGRYDLPRLWEGLAHQRPRGVFRIAS
jgi:hypothetical protein